MHGLRTMRRFLHMEDENARPIGFFCAETELRTAKLNEAPKKSHLDTAKSPHSPLYWRERRASRAQVHKNFLKILLSQPVHPVEFSKNTAPWRKFEKMTRYSTAKRSKSRDRRGAKRHVRYHRKLHSEGNP